MSTTTKNTTNRTWGRAAVAWETASRRLYRAEMAGRPTAHLRETERARWAELCAAKAAATAGRPHE